MVKGIIKTTIANAKKNINRPVDFEGYDGQIYNGRITDVKYGSISFTYYVRGIGECTGVVEKKDFNRIAIL